MSEDSQNNAEGDSNEQPQDTPRFEVNGEMLTAKQISSGMMMQQDYTRKTQELAEQRKQFESNVPAESGEQGEEEEVARAVKLLKDNGFVTQQDIQEKQRIDGLMNANPELARQRAAIEALARAEGKAPEDVIVKYGFMEEAKLEAAKSRVNVMGMPTPKEQPKAKSIEEMSSTEYATWKAERKGGGRGWKNS